MRNVIRLGLYLGLALCAMSAKQTLALSALDQKSAAVKPDSAVEQKPEAPVLDVLSRYQAAMEARSVERLAEVMHPEVLVLEGIYKNGG